MNIRNSFNRTIAGTLLFLSGAVILMGIITSESLYPFAYTTAQNEISDLGATRPPDSIIHQPSATIFNVTMIVTGSMILIATYFVHTQYQKFLVTIPLALLGLGVLGVGVFPGNNAVIHPLFALMAFVAGGFAAITSSIVLKPPFRYIAPFFGAIGLFSLFFASRFMPIFGDGGVERWVAYPIVLWIIGFGGYILGTQAAEKS